MRKGAYGTHQSIYRRVAVVSRNVVMELFPEFFDVVNPRLIRRLEQDLELRIMVQPGLCQVGFVDDVVIGNEDNLSGTAVSAFEVF